MARIAAVHQATEAAERKRLRAFEHQVDLRLRLHRGEVTHGLQWTEDTSRLTHRPCAGCGRDGGRRWVGAWFEYQAEPKQEPFATVTTVELCAPCTSKLQTEAQEVPIWRPARPTT